MESVDAVISEQFNDPSILAGIKLHPSFEGSIRPYEGKPYESVGKPAWHDMLIGFTHSSRLTPWMTQDREGEGAWPDSEERIQHLMGQIKSEGLHTPLMMGYNLRTGEAGLEEGHHRLAAVRRLGGMVVPVIGKVGTSSHSRYRQGPTNLVVPDKFGWYPKTVDPLKITG